ncbi:predicted protein [Coccidioides posadasii str. Silveira]|uniref:Predicted protein n=1 Tax=Coccidioides posadasii (strain RMSCC 757 / Silveira) TaxID=443226 RepID=E9CW63_COCPS|nr:predicted protein [Coccidioides posadasii str. Silveira]
MGVGWLIVLFRTPRRLSESLRRTTRCQHPSPSPSPFDTAQPATNVPLASRVHQHVPLRDLALGLCSPSSLSASQTSLTAPTPRSVKPSEENGFLCPRSPIVRFNGTSSKRSVTNHPVAQPRCYVAVTNAVFTSFFHTRAMSSLNNAPA